MASTMNPLEMEELDNRFVVIHPLDDAPEEKVDTESLGPMPMTVSVRISLISLRAYLVLMVMLVFYHALDLAGLFGHHG
jgi:hypothetical protein